MLNFFWTQEHIRMLNYHSKGENNQKTPILENIQKFHGTHFHGQKVGFFNVSQTPFRISLLKANKLGTKHLGKVLVTTMIPQHTSLYVNGPGYLTQHIYIKPVQYGYHLHNKT